MRVLLDSSFIYSALTSNGTSRKVFLHLIQNHVVMLSDYIIIEIERNLRKKVGKNKSMEVMENFHELVELSYIIKKDKYSSNMLISLKKISKKDAPILACALLDEVDILLTGDKEFRNLDLDNLNTIGPSEFMKSYIERCQLDCSS